MYGKIFSTMYEGSMFGAGGTAFAIMGYVISKQRPPEYNVELHPGLLAAIIGDPEDRINVAIEFLCAPDPKSRSDTEDGKRLVKIGAFTYHVVNGAAYDAIKNYEERKAYNRDAQARYRAKKATGGEVVPEFTAQPKKFSKPTVDDLIANGLPATEADNFLNHYDSKGWKVGKNPMVDWKAAVRGWKSRMGKFQSNGKQQDDQDGYGVRPGETDAQYARRVSQC
jgi:hypothetical protein